MSTQTGESSTVRTPPNAVEMEETIARIRSHKGVECVIIMDRRGAFRSVFLKNLVTQIVIFR